MRFNGRPMRIFFATEVFKKPSAPVSFANVCDLGCLVVELLCGSLSRDVRKVVSNISEGKVVGWVTHLCFSSQQLGTDYLGLLLFCLIGFTLGFAAVYLIYIYICTHICSVVFCE